MADEYVRLVEEQARNRMEELTRQMQQDIVNVYVDAGKQLADGYKRSPSGTATKALYASYTQKIADETQQIIEEYSLAGAKLAPDVERLIMSQAFQMAGLDTSVANDVFRNMVGRLGMESVKNVVAGGIYKDGVGLSSRIWQSSAMASNSIQQVIAAGLAQDMGAAKLSRLLQDFVNPTARNTWSNDKIRSILGDGYAAWNKSLEYNALRLARTTLAHTATMSMRQVQKVNPYATKIMWHSVHAAGRTCSICEDMDGQVYDTDKCPFDHPNGMCYQTHEFEKSLNEMADELAAWCKGEPNEVLDEWWKSVGGHEVSPKPQFVFTRYTTENIKQLIDRHKSWESSVPKDQRSAAKAYIGKSGDYTYEKINKYMRGQTAKISASNKKIMDNLTDLTRSCTVKESFVAVRGTDCDTFRGIIPNDLISKIQNVGGENLDSDDLARLTSAVVGSTFQDPGFMSTSYNTWGSFYRECRLEIGIPEGSNCGAFISSFGTRSEDEFLLAPGTTLVFDGCEVMKNGIIKILAHIV